MSAPFRRAIGNALSRKSFAQCAGRRPTRLSQSQLPQFGHARCFRISPAAWSGHSKWASIKHDKGKNDVAKSKQRAQQQQDISNAVKLGGADPNNNPRLALAIATAKKNAVPKANIEAAIARGQGLSTTGKPLEFITFEALLPQSVALIVECQTDNKLRTMADLKLLIKDFGGNVASVGYYYEKKGRIILKHKEGVDNADDIYDTAVDAGILEMLTDQDGRAVMFTNVEETKAVAEKICKAHGYEVDELEIVYDPEPDTNVELEDEDYASDLNDFLDKIHELSGIQAVYMNLANEGIDEELYMEIREKLNVPMFHTD